ncbi:DUF1446 domain-containing protein [Ramlibacter henchirensis]|uniref:DUF1446 domain-containing protein n=1 Tax=Ramlibacter henchirensis TaxID=204072 RepID=A0A4Z0BWK9_9BURK|nr:acyclic terpene utilization AtuA family protein [Ramlibacter henchirensis]TFZ02740.1 DUF1446 domain-containing protein [Ramlibacter henchirensis]
MSEPVRREPLVVASFSGYYGDRITALDEAMAGDPIHVLIGDYLAEITLAGISARYRKDPTQGYADYFVRQVQPHLPAIAARGIKLVTNAGGLNPRGLADVLRGLIREAGLSLKVACVEGDNVLDRLGMLQAAGHPLSHLDTGEPLSAWGRTPISANAYLGAWGITAALREGADIVLCGRVTDSSLTLGPAAWWHGWQQADWDRLAGGVVAGHIIECGPHATGGNFSGFAVLPAITYPGFVMAELAADGSCVVTKHARDGGAVTTDTVTAQLVYEIQGPMYLNPDVTVDLGDVRCESVGPDRIRVSGARGAPPPETTKVAIFATEGWQIVSWAFVTGIDVDRKLALLRAQLHSLLAGSVDQLEVTAFGTPAAQPESQAEATVAVRIAACASERDQLTEEQFFLKLNSLYLWSVPGFHTDSGAERALKPQRRIEYWPALLHVSQLSHRVTLEDGRTLEMPPHPQAAPAVSQPVHPEPGRSATDSRRAMQRAPLGRIAYARSGDKGGNSNVGLWAAQPKAWPWLRETLTTDMLRRLLPQAQDLEIVRHEFPNIRAVHFIVRGHLGRGGSTNLQADQVGKALGEFLLARQLDIPVELLVDDYAGERAPAPGRPTAAPSSPTAAVRS